MKTMNIDWNKLESCRGTSDPELIPEAISKLFSTDSNVRTKGYWGIDNHTVVQSDLYSSAPYAARLIVDRLISGEAVTYEVINILFELHNGFGPDKLTAGPLAGDTLDSLCKSIVGESKDYLLSSRSQLPSELIQGVDDLLETFNDENI